MEFVTKRDVTVKALAHASRVCKFLNMATVQKYGFRSQNCVGVIMFTSTKY